METVIIKDSVILSTDASVEETKKGTLYVECVLDTTVAKSLRNSTVTLLNEETETEVTVLSALSTGETAVRLWSLRCQPVKVEEPQEEVKPAEEEAKPKRSRRADKSEG